MQHSSLKVMISTMLVLTMIFSVPSWHTAGVGVVHAAQFSGAGTGTVSDPYQISTAEQLDEVRDHLTSHFILTEDIDLSNYASGAGWSPIKARVGYDGFAGSLDGKKHKITNLKIQTIDNNAGLFAYLEPSGQLSNIILENVEIKGQSFLGSLVGSSKGSVRNVSVTGSVEGSFHVGGLVGMQTGGSISNCYTKVDVIVQYSNGGGIMGIDGLSDEAMIITNSYAAGTVISLDSSTVGGIAALIISSNSIYTNTYYDQDKIPVNDSGKGTGKTAAEMQDIETYVDWDFDTIWSISPAVNDGYPYLNVQAATVSYDGNNGDRGTVPVDSKSYLSGDSVTVAGNMNGLYKTDYLFDGWNTEQDGSGATYYAGESLPIARDTTLYAIWKLDGISLSSLSVSGAVLSEPFSSSQLNYTVHVPHSVTNLGLSFTPLDPLSTISVTGAVYEEKIINQYMYHVPSLQLGSQQIEIAVTAQDQISTSTYRVTVIRSSPVTTPGTPVIVRSSNANLSRLVLNSEGTTLEPSPAFAPEIVQYTVETDAEQVEVQLAVADSRAIVKIQNQLIGNSINIPLELGAQTIVFIVQAEDGTKKEYAITLTRRAIAEDSSQEAVCTLTDIQDHWAEADICKAVSLGIVEGVSTAIFAPDRTITRTEFVTMLLRTLQIPIHAERMSLPFNDTAGLPSWMQAAIQTGVSEGMLTGYTDGSFRPHQTISRIELATMLAKAMKWEGSSTPNLPFADQGNISAWARPYVGVVHARGILQGRGGNLFTPNGITTRAEATVTLLRLWNTIS